MHLKFLIGSDMIVSLTYLTTEVYHPWYWEPLWTCMRGRKVEHPGWMSMVITFGALMVCVKEESFLDWCAPFIWMHCSTSCKLLALVVILGMSIMDHCDMQIIWSFCVLVCRAFKRLSQYVNSIVIDLMSVIMSRNQWVSHLTEW